MLAAAGWILIVPLLLTVFSQTFSDGTGITALVMAQTLLPYGAPFAIVIGVAALATRRRGLAVSSIVVALGTAVLAAPLVWHPEPPVVDAAAPTLTVTFANLSHRSTSTALAADALLDTQADVLVMGELTPPVVAALDAIGGADGYPYRAGDARVGDDGTAIWSRFPLADVSLAPIGSAPGVEATVVVGDRSLRIVTAQPDPPFAGSDADTWVADLRALNERARATDAPTLVVADVNASWWHPPYRRTVSDGLIDVHRVLGDGFSTSWPTDEPTPRSVPWPAAWLADLPIVRDLVPPFTRLDHALIRGRVQPIAIGDVEIPGSDHEGFTVRLALGRSG